jgi:hypothetical protein
MRISQVLVFDGRIAYICPKCGAEQKFVSVWWRIERADVVPFTILPPSRVGILSLPERIVFDGKSLRNFFNLTLRDVELEDEPFHCPSCHEPLEPEDVRKGFWQWLERLKKEDPKKHAEVIALLL